MITSVPRASTRMLAPIASLTSTLSVPFSSQLRAVKAYGLLVNAPTYRLRGHSGIQTHSVTSPQASRAKYKPPRWHEQCEH